MVFDAPWGRSLKLMTLFSTILLLGVAGAGILFNPGGDIIWTAAMILLPLIIWFGGACFIVRGFRIDGNTLVVLRPGWKTVLNLEGLQSVEIDPEAMSRSIRTFGNGGLFSFTGRFRNARLGPYRAFANDPGRAVVLRFTDRVIVVTPGKPESFSQALSPGN